MTPQDSRDEIWEDIRKRAEKDAQKEPMLASFLYATVLNHNTFESSLSFLLAHKLESPTLTAATLRDLINEAYGKDPKIARAIREDIAAVCDRDPACDGFANILLFYKGYHALQAYRAAHYYWTQGRRSLAKYLQNRISEVFAVDIHPAAQIGHGILIDHATGVVIGETAVVEDFVSMLHEVTLGGTGKVSGDRHPKVRRGVLIAAGAKILGNVEIGEGAKIAAGAVVLEDVPPHTTVAGVPAKIVGTPSTASPALEMDQRIEQSMMSAGL
jgi:serine O-acetyltransferase